MLVNPIIPIPAIRVIEIMLHNVTLSAIFLSTKHFLLLIAPIINPPEIAKIGNSS